MNQERLIKIVIFLTLFLWGLFCMLKSYGYCDEIEYDVPIYTIEEEAQFKHPIIPIDEEFLYIHKPKPKKYGYISPYDHQWQNPQQKIKNPTLAQKKEWQESYDFHLLHAKRTYEDAKNRVWWLPEISWRQRGREAWVAAFSTVGAQTVQLKLIVAISSLLCQYGLDCLDEWEYIEDKLNWSKYHLEQCAIYAQKLQN